jgi:hypothetical protein
MQRSLDAISATCISCHSQYRDFTGELGPRKASADGDSSAPPALRVGQMQ